MSNPALLLSLCLGVLFLTLGSPGFNQTIDPLSGVGPGSGDTRTDTPTTANPPSPFGFTSFPGGISGELLVRNNEDNASTGLNFVITGAPASPGETALVSGWNGNGLGAYLGISTPLPPNLIGAFFSRPPAFDFFPYQTDVGAGNKLPSPSSLTEPLAASGSAANAPYLAVFLSQGICPGPSCGYTATKVRSKAGLGDMSILIKIAPLLAVLGVALALGLRLGRRP